MRIYKQSELAKEQTPKAVTSDTGVVISGTFTYRRPTKDSTPRERKFKRISVRHVDAVEIMTIYGDNHVIVREGTHLGSIETVPAEDKPKRLPPRPRNSAKLWAIYPTRPYRYGSKPRPIAYAWGANKAAELLRDWWAARNEAREANADDRTQIKFANAVLAHKVMS